MTNPKILTPQELPSVFQEVAEEKNWLIFAVGRPHPDTGKRGKRPIVGGKPWTTGDRDKAANKTYATARQNIKQLTELYTVEEVQRRIDESHKEWVEDFEAGEVKKRPPAEPFQYSHLIIGYFPREGSGLIAVDLDDCVEGEKIKNRDVSRLIKRTEAYVERSSSGTGLKVFMPRGFGDDTIPAGDIKGVGGVSANNKSVAQAVTFDIVKDGAGYDPALIAYIQSHRKAPTKEKAKKNEEGIIGQVLEHGRLELDEFIEYVLPLVPNLEDYTWGDASGMMSAAREYYEEIDPDRVDTDLRDALYEWWCSWHGEPETGKPVDDETEFERALAGAAGGPGSKTTMGSWLKPAFEGGYERAEDRASIIDERKPMLPEPASIVETKGQALDRFVLVNDRFFDRYSRELLDRGNTGLANTIARAFYTVSKEGKRKPQSVDQIIMHMRHKAHVFRAARFMPGAAEIVDGVINIWKPLPVYPETDAPLPWINHIRYLYGTHADMLIDWLAFTVQNPGLKIGFAPVLIGPQGCGKDTILEPIVATMGHPDYGYAIGNMSTAALDDTHNGWLERAILVVMQESVAGRMTKANVTERLKTMISSTAGSTLPLRKMGQDTRQIPNVLNMVFLTNHLDTLYVEDDDRRFWPLVTENKPDAKYFEALYKWIGEGGREAVLGYLQRRHVRLVRAGMEAPASEFKRLLIEASLPEGGQEVLDYVEDKRWFSTRVMKNALAMDEDLSRTGWKMPDRLLGKLLRQQGFAPAFDKRISVWSSGRAIHHHVWARIGVSLSEEIVKAALLEGGDKLEKASCYPKDGVRDENRGNVFSIE